MIICQQNRVFYIDQESENSHTHSCIVCGCSEAQSTQGLKCSLHGLYRNCSPTLDTVVTSPVNAIISFFSYQPSYIYFLYCTNQDLATPYPKTMVNNSINNKRVSPS